MTFNDLFQSPDPARKQFIADVLNLFSGDIVRCWTADSRSAYDDVGKPTLRRTGAGRGLTLDFALRRRQRVYVALMQCDLAGDFVLTDPAQVDAANTTKTFGMFLDAAAHPEQYRAIIGDEAVEIAGSILVWGSVDEKAARTTKKRYGLQDILSLEHISADLVAWQNRDFQMLLDRRVAWSHDLFKTLRQR